MTGAGALLAVALVVLSLAGPAAADDPAQPSTPPPTPVLSPPSQEQIDDAKEALDRVRNAGKSPAPAPDPITQVAGPTEDGGSVVSRISDEAWWVIGAGLLVLLVASETTRLGVRRAKHRRGA